MNNRRAPSRDALFLRRGIGLSNAKKEREDDLALFLDMRKREKEFTGNLLLPVSDEFDAVLGGDKISSSPLYKIPGSTPTPKRRGGPNDFLTADGDKNDYDWLLTPPGTPLFPSLEMEPQATGSEQRETPVVRPLAPVKTSRLSNSQNNSSLKTAKGGSRQTTPSFAAAKKPSATTPTSAPSSRSSTPSSRSSVSAYKPSSRPSTRSTTPVQRSSTTAQHPSKTAQRPSITAQRPSTTAQRSSPKLTQNNLPPGRSSSVSKASTIPSRNPSHSRGTSPTVKSKPLQPSTIAGFSLETPPNLRTEMPGRSSSANRGRPGALSSAQSRTGAPASSEKPRRQSCSPSVTRGRVSNDSLNGNKSSLQTIKQSNGIQGTVQAVVGSKMVEKLMNARRSNPQGQVEEVTNQSVGSTLNIKRSVKSASSQESPGFGRTISKTSLDMALRHMDIRGTKTSGFRSHLTNIPASSLYSVRSGAIKSKSSSKSGSPMATSSNASSEYSARIAPAPEGSEFDDDDIGSERGSRSSRATRQDSFDFKGDGKSTDWLLSTASTGDRDDQSFISDQGFEMLSDPMEDVARALSAFENNNGKSGTDY